MVYGLDIRLGGAIEDGQYGQAGLFSVIGSNRPEDAAQVKDLIFSNVSVSVDFSNGLAAAGTLAGEVNGYAEASNVAVLSGKVTVNPSRACPTGFPPPIPLNHGTRQHKDIALIPLLP
ncbi:MAG: hypothetical protein HFH38_01060 [Lachnospiraceae bacterium]|nr:hypothetical protein [Lachnospiraceae bacterium]